MNTINKYFDIEKAIGKEITENEFQVLMASKRIWVTKVRFNNHYEAHAAIGGDIDSFNEFSNHVYGGSLVTENPDDSEEADCIANERGWGEKVEGVLCGVIPYDSIMINPCNIVSEQLN